MAFPGAMGEAAAEGKVTPGDAMDLTTAYTALFTEFGEPVVSKG